MNNQNLQRKYFNDKSVTLKLRATDGKLYNTRLYTTKSLYRKED